MDDNVKAVLEKYSWEAYPSKHLKYFEIGAFDLETSLASDEVMHITDQKVSDADCTALGKALTLMKPENMKNIYLSNNDIGDEGVVALADACSTHDALPRLKKLWLQRNSIGDAGLTALAKACNDGALAECLYIGLDDNRGSWRANRAVSDALKNRAVG